jgi:hypothetical protein
VHARAGYTQHHTCWYTGASGLNINQPYATQLRSAEASRPILINKQTAVVQSRYPICIVVSPDTHIHIPVHPNVGDLSTYPTTTARPAATTAPAASSTRVTTRQNSLGGSMARRPCTMSAKWRMTNAKKAPKCSDMSTALKPITGMEAAGDKVQDIHSERWMRQGQGCVQRPSFGISTACTRPVEGPLCSVHYISLLGGMGHQSATPFVIFTHCVIIQCTFSTTSCQQDPHVVLVLHLAGTASWPHIMHNVHHFI